MTQQKAPNLCVITCAVMETEVEAFLESFPPIARYIKMQQGLHNEPEKLQRKLQHAIDEAEADPAVQRIALVYGLCSKGIEGLRVARCTLAVARAHDCITLLLGSRERYDQYTKQNPGTYWYSPGWNRHHTPPGQQRYEKLLSEYREKYGDDNAEFLMETEQHWFSTYDRAAYVHLTVGATQDDKNYTKQCADWLDWNYDEQAGDPQLLKDLITGNWDDDRFLVIQPNQAIRMTGDQNIVTAITLDGNTQATSDESPSPG